jgi:transposase
MSVSPGYLVPIKYIDSPDKSTEFSEDGRVVKFKVKARNPPYECPGCHTRGPFRSNGNAEVRYVRDLPAWGRPTVYEVYGKRYICDKCGKTFGDNFDSIFDGHTTIRLKEHLVDRVLRRDTFKKISADYGVADQTVKRAFDEWAAAHAWQLQYDTPIVMGIDEAHIDRHYRLIVVDILKKLPIDMLPNNRPATVLKYLKDLPHKENVLAVTMDFKADYAKAIKESFNSLKWKPLIIIDHYHVIQDINRKLDAIRKRVQTSLGEKTDEEEEEDWWLNGEDETVEITDSGKEKKKLKKERRLFLTNVEDLDEKEMDRLLLWMKRDERLKKAFDLKEQFRDIYRKKLKYEESEAWFDMWCNSIPDSLKELQSAAKYFQRRKEHILNYFHLDVTNAYAEYTSRNMKDVERSGRGYDFDRLKKIVLFSARNPRPPKIDLKALLFMENGMQ